MNEEDLSTQRSEAGQNPWLPEADVDQGGPGCDSGPSGQGSSTSVGLTSGVEAVSASPRRIRNVSRRSTFLELRRTPHRGRSGVVTVRFSPESGDCVAVAFAITRKFGNAVARNRRRRQLRAIMYELAPVLPSGAFLLAIRDGGPELSYDELRDSLSQALHRAIPGWQDQGSDVTTTQGVQS